MTFRFSLACECRLLLILFSAVASLEAQGHASGDLLSGTWAGYIALTAGSPSAATFEFKLGPAGKVAGVVTGPRLTPGDISGSFDSATGALKFAVVVRDGSGTAAFDGRVARDSAVGIIAFKAQQGEFRLARGGKSAAVVAQTLVAHEGDMAAAMRRSFVEVSDWITRAAELVPAERYSYKPTQSVKTFGQIVGHLVDASRYYCGRGAGRRVEWSEASEKGTVTKAVLVPALRQALADCVATYDAPRQSAPLIDNVGHSSLHYGNLVTYIRMMGLTPPSS